MQLDLTLLWMIVLAAAIGMLYVQNLWQIQVRIDASYLFALCLFFDCFGYYAKALLPVSPIIMLMIVPAFLGAAAMFKNPVRIWEELGDSTLWLWILFLVWAALSLLWSDNAAVGLSKWSILLIRGIIPAAFLYVIYSRYERFSWTIVLFAGLFFACSLLAFGVYDVEFPGRLTLPGTNPIFNARLAFLTAAICIWAVRVPWILRGITFAISMLAGLMTQSRGPLLVFIAVNTVMLAIACARYFHRTRFASFAYYSLPALILLVAGAMAVSTYWLDLQGWIMSSRFSTLLNSAQWMGDDNVMGRVDLQSEALIRFIESPFIGGGLGSVSPPNTLDFPHNLLIEVASELGTVGVVLWCLALLFSFIAAFRDALLVVLLLMTIGYAAMSGDFGYNYEYVVVAWLAIIHAKIKAREGCLHEPGVVINHGT